MGGQSLPSSSGRGVASVRALCLVLAAVLVGACFRNADPRAGEPRQVSRDQLARLGSSHGGNRPIEHLDINDDGALSKADWQLFLTLQESATAALGEEDPFAVEGGLYKGPPADAPSIFSLVALRAGKVDLSGIPRERLSELAIEARWAAQQTQIASLAPTHRKHDPNHGSRTPQTFSGLLSSWLPGYDPRNMEPAALCAGLATVDFSVLDGSAVPSAIFDLDSTVWEGNVTDVFLAILAERNVPLESANGPLRDYLKTLEGVDPAVVDGNTVGQNAALLLERATDSSLPKPQRVSAKDAFYNTVALLAGLDVSAVETAARAAFEEGSAGYPAWKDQIFADEDGCNMAEVVRVLQEKGVRVYLLSATLDVLAIQGARLLGVPPEQVLGSVLEVVDGKYTGKVADSTYYTKGAITRQWLPSPPLFAFGDSPTSDFPMLLEAAVAAFMVNPRDGLRARDDAEAGSWMVAVWFDGTIGELGRR